MTATHFDFDTPIDRRSHANYKWNKYPSPVLPLWVADMDFQTAPAVIQALHQEVDHGIFGYATPKPGLAEVVVARLQQRYNWSIEADWIVWIPGVVPGLAASCRTAGEIGDEVIINPPVYHHLITVPEKSLRTLVNAPLHCVDGRWTFDFDAICAAITPRTRMLLLCSPHNPVGTLFRADELAELGRICAQHGIQICSDEIHCELVLDHGARHTPTAVACPDYQHNIITLMAPSKTFNLAGVNCSFAIISDPALRKKFSGSIGGAAPPVSALAYAAALAAYRDGDAWHQALLDYLRANRDFLQAEVAQIPGLSMPHVEASYLGWIDTQALATDDAHGLFLQHGLGFSDGAQFGDPRFQRINFGCTRTNLEEAVARIKRAVTEGAIAR